MTGLDADIVRAASYLGGQYVVLDVALAAMLKYATFKIVPLIALLAAVAACQRGHDRRWTLVSAVVASGLALLVARLVQNFGPSRPRPAFSGEFHFPLDVIGLTPDWSSFPSDTTALGAALATVIWFASRRAGQLAFGWTLILALAKLVTGYHYPSDLFVGLAIGIVAACAVNGPALPRRAAAPLVDRIADRAPGAFWMLMFLALFQLATMFNDIRQVAHTTLAQAGIDRDHAAPATEQIAQTR